MSKPIAYRDLLVRCFVVMLTSAVLVAVTERNDLDLHFKIRKAQSTSEHVQIVTLKNSQPIEVAIRGLLDRGVQRIFVSQFEHETSQHRVTPFSFEDHNPNYMNLEVGPDTDGIVRRFKFVGQLPLHRSAIEPNKYLNINFRGPKNTFDWMPYSDLLSSGFDVKDKLIVLTNDDDSTLYTTPVGLLAETEIVATLLDNLVENRFIPFGKIWSQVLLLFMVLLSVTTLLILLPSTLALASTFIFSIFYFSLSMWLFDQLYIWTPILTPMVEIVLTFVLISNYKSVLNEKTKWNLEKESLLFDEVEEMKTNFLSLFSHDLKTPLAKIIGITDTLLSQPHDPKLKSELEKIHISTKNLEKYIQRILKMSMVQSRNISLNKNPEDINELIRKSIEHNRIFAQEKEIKLREELSPLFMIDIDGSLIQEVIINLVENAIKYSPCGSTVVIKSEEHRDNVKISVIDQGEGIPKSVQDNIWEKYYRFNDKQAGYGLGLFLSRYVVTLHGGQVFLNSKERSGSEFGFILPIQENPS